MSVLLDYQARLDQIRAALARARSFHLYALLALSAALLLMAVTGVLALGKRVAPWWPLAPASAVLLAARRYRINRSAWSRWNRLESFYRRGLARVSNESDGTGFTGEEFQVAGHAYEPDLGILGAGSLFELICTARTEIGRRRLAEYLLSASDAAEAKARQEAVRELSLRPDLSEDIALLGQFDFEDSSGARISGWLEGTFRPAGALVRLAALAGSLGLSLVLVYTYFARPVVVQSWVEAAPWLAALGLSNAAIAALFHRQAKDRLKDCARVGLEIGVLRDGLRLVQRQEFACLKLRGIREDLSHKGAAQALSRLARMTGALDRCNNPFLELAARAAIARTQIWFALEGWRARHGDALKDWMHAWAEFEALAALAGYAREHPENCYPDFVDDGNVFEAKDLGHPLLPLSACVRNDISLGGSRRFYAISGSNMAGKSTLLRAIGLSAAMAYAGAPVRATSLRISNAAVCASLSIVDSLREGKSKFLAEVEKLRQMVTAAQAGARVLFLIDEVLAGTNSRDRRIAAEAIVRTLVEHGAVGALSTHDLSLTEIAEEAELGGTNVHMGSRGGSDPLDFDFVLKPGVTRESNATAIASMAGCLPANFR